MTFGEIAAEQQDICDNTCAKISFRDYGTGIPNEDMPFIFEKFYRGKNCGKEQGSGLGLYSQE